MLSNSFNATFITPEMLMKLFASRGFRAYLSNTTNIFDFVVVLSSLPTLLEPIVSGTLDPNKSSLSALSAFRVFRLFRVFRIARLLHKSKSMRMLLARVFSSMTAIGHLSVFILFTLITGSILATNVFSRPYPPSPDVAEAVNDAGYSIYAGGSVPRYHFDTFFHSMLNMFVLMTGTWRSSMTS
jgi:hypothetical protein